MSLALVLVRNNRVEILRTFSRSINTIKTYTLSYLDFQGDFESQSRKSARFSIG